MPRINLLFLRRDPQKLGAEEIYHERIKALLALGKSGQVVQDCIIDTGCTLSVFPQRHWKRFENDIDWLYTRGSRDDLPDWLAKATGLGATPIDCQIGKVRIQIIELPSGSKSPPVEIIAKCPFDNGLYSQILLGLGGNAFPTGIFLCGTHSKRPGWNTDCGWQS
jgi:hypothetical protein